MNYNNLYNQNVKKTSPPKNTKLMNIKNININNNLYNCYSLLSSLLFPLACAYPLGLFDPNISSQVNPNVNNPGNNPNPIMNPLWLLPKKGFPLPLKF